MQERSNQDEEHYFGACGQLSYVYFALQESRIATSNRQTLVLSREIGLIINLARNRILILLLILFVRAIIALFHHYGRRHHHILLEALGLQALTKLLAHGQHLPATWTLPLNTWTKCFPQSSYWVDQVCIPLPYNHLVTMRCDVIPGNEQLFAMKTVMLKRYPNQEIAWNHMLLEARVMEFLTGVSSIPLVHGVFRDGNESRMVQEFVGDDLNLTRTSIKNVLYRGRPTLPALDCITITSEVANGLRAMHTRGLLHNGVAFRNILIYYSGAHFRAKLADFGMVSCLQEPRRSKRTKFASDDEIDQFIELHPEVPPEKFMYGAFDSVVCDIFSLGFVIDILGMAIANDDMSDLGEACTWWDSADRPTLDHVIITLDRIADNERTNPVCRAIDRPLF